MTDHMPPTYILVDFDKFHEMLRTIEKIKTYRPKETPQYIPKEIWECDNIKPLQWPNVPTPSSPPAECHARLTNTRRENETSITNDRRRAFGVG